MRIAAGAPGSSSTSAFFDAVTPLCRGKCTSIELYSDYLELRLRNAIGELVGYRSEQHSRLSESWWESHTSGLSDIAARCCLSLILIGCDC